MSRTESSIKNITAGLIGQFFATIVSFFARKIFLLFLSVDYLGINGVFSNVLTMLSLFELGIGPAIVFSLYKPLNEGDDYAVRALMQLYRKAYTVIGVAVLACGFAITPFVHIFVGELPDIPNIRLIYALFVLNTGMSYFFAYKRSLVIADQKQYITVIYHYAVYICLNIAQIVVLYLTQNYLLFLLLQIVATVVENVLISRKADKLYPILHNKTPAQIAPEAKFEIQRNVKAMIAHRCGGIVVSATDNILISNLVSVAVAGLYSNYLMLVNALNSILYQFFSSISASVGSLGAMRESKDAYKIFKNINFFNFWIFCFATISFYFLANPLISNLWLGEGYELEPHIVALIALNFYISGVRQTVLTFKEALGLNWVDWYKPILEAVVNLVVSIILGKMIGLAGIFVGTLVSRLGVTLWIEPAALMRSGFKMKAYHYYKDYFKYLLLLFALWWITGQVIALVPGDGLAYMVMCLCVCLVVPNGLLALLFCKTEGFAFLLDTAKRVLNRLLHRKKM